MPTTDQNRDHIAAMLLDRRGDTHPGLRTRENNWTWDEVVAESITRAGLGRKLLDDEPDMAPHIGVLLPNVADFVFWLGAAALAG